MTISETIARYGGKTVRLTLDNAEYQDFKQLLEITKEYADHEAEVWGYQQQPDVHRNAIHRLEDVRFGFDHYDGHRDEPLVVPGNAMVFLTRGKFMDNEPNRKFMRKMSVKALIDRLRKELGIPDVMVVDGQ